MRRWKVTRRIVLVAMAVCLLCCTTAQAKKPDTPPGGGGDETTPFSVIELPGFAWADGRAHAVSNPDAAGIVTVAGEGSEGGFVTAAYALIDVASREVLVSGFLPEPTDTAPVDFGSHARDVNTVGVIVGGADVYDETVPGNRRSVPVRWIPDEAGSIYELLPLLEGDSYGAVNAINQAGEMVGASQTYSSSRPAYWTADGASVVDLNDLLLLGSGWNLLTADDININGQVVGQGVLDGFTRGFVLDLSTSDITAVPLVAGAVENEAWQINDAGHVIGKANDGVMGGGPFPQGGWGYFWAGLNEPQLLASFTDGAAIVRGINNLNELAGDSHVPGALPGNGDLFMSLWQPDNTGSFTATDISTQIPSKPTWYLYFGFGINDDMWIAGNGRKRVKGKYSWHGVLVVPNP